SSHRLKQQLCSGLPDPCRPARLHIRPPKTFTGPVRALIIAHGESPSAGLLRELADDADLVVAADGGLLVARAAGVEVDAVVGDLDSLDEGTIAALPAGTVHQDTDHDSTDLQKAIEFALSRGAT